MIKYFFIILISLLFFNQTFAKNVSINENIDLEFVCDLEKKIIKNSEYNYQTFLAKDLNEKGLDSFKILSKKTRNTFNQRIIIISLSFIKT